MPDRIGLSGMTEVARFRQGFEVAQLLKRDHGDKGRLSFLIYDLKLYDLKLSRRGRTVKA